MPASGAPARVRRPARRRERPPRRRQRPSPRRRVPARGGPPRPLPPARPLPVDDSIDLGATVLPVLVKSYAPYAVAALAGLLLGWLLGRRGS